jgi:hypothetical protein
MSPSRQEAPMTTSTTAEVRHGSNEPVAGKIGGFRGG